MLLSGIVWLNLTAMIEKITISIPTPCHEKWEQFTPTSKGGFCGSCQKEVIDFTTWSEDEIKHYFRSGANSACGRFRSNQLITYHSDLSLPASRPTRWAAALTFLLLLITRQTEAQTSSTPATQEMVKKKNEMNKVAVDSITRFTLRGVVTEGDSGQVLPGVNVIRKGTTQSTVTDVDGKFEIVIDHPKTVEIVVVSFIGLITTEKEVSVTSEKKDVKIALQPDITGAISSVRVGGIVAHRWYSPRGLWWRVKRLFMR